MVKEVTDEIISAMFKLKLSYGSNDALGKALGISKKHVGQILRGNVDYLQKETWEHMQPHLRHLLSDHLVLKESCALYKDQYDEIAEWLRKDAASDIIQAVVTTCRGGGFKSQVKDPPEK